MNPAPLSGRYKMLLERLVKNMERSSSLASSDLALVRRALATVSGVASHVNESLSSRQEQLRLLELQNSFFPPVDCFVAPGRRLAKAGELDKLSDRSGGLKGQRYAFFLMSDGGLAYGSKLFGGYYRFHRIVTLKKVDADADADDANAAPRQLAPATSSVDPAAAALRFRVLGEERDLTLQAKSLEERRKWIEALHKALDARRAAAASFAQARRASS